MTRHRLVWVLVVVIGAAAGWFAGEHGYPSRAATMERWRRPK